MEQEKAPNWQACSAISDIPTVHDMFLSFINDHTNDNAICIVRGVLAHSPVNFDVLRNWQAMIHDNERSMGDRLQSLSSYISLVLDNRPAALATIREQLGSGYVVANGKDGDKLRYRTMSTEGIEWTRRKDTALRFVRRIDAERFCAEDEDAWRILSYDEIPE